MDGAMRRLLVGALAAVVVTLAGCRREAPAPPIGVVADDESPPELVAMLQELLPRIERLSGLDRVELLRMRRQSREDARRYIEARLDSEMPPARLDGMRRTYAALGLVPDTLDLRSLMLELYTEQVLGYYDARTSTLYVLEGEDVESLRPVLTHELVHALQDQHTDLDSLVAYGRGNDRQAAAHAALEGHAMVVMFAVLAEEATRRRIDPATLPNPADELGPALEAQNEQYPVFRRAPRIIRETLLFPYLHGSDFVYHVWQAVRGTDRYPAPIDTLLPQSTAQVMRPVERFIQRRIEPVELRFDVDSPSIYENTFGQLETAIFLESHLGAAARAAAQGWAGDRYMLEEGAAGDVLHWVSVWESDAEADRFADAARRAAAGRAGRSVSVGREQVDGLPAVRIVDAAAPADPTQLPVPAARRVAAAAR
jgi:heme-degrading monooxygenase HmoA